MPTAIIANASLRMFVAPFFLLVASASLARSPRRRGRPPVAARMLTARTTALQQFDVLLLFGGQDAACEQVGHTYNGAQRRSEFVAHDR